MKNETHGSGASLDDLLALVEKAAATIERLQAANATLTSQLRAREAAEQLMESNLQQLISQVEALRKDAEWTHWFRNRHRNSIFYAHIEQEYLAAQREAQAPPGMNGNDEGLNDSQRAD